jgi:cytochrome P450 family 6
LVVTDGFHSYFNNSYWADLNVLCFEPTFPFGNIKGINKTRNLHEITQHYYELAKTSGKKFVGLYFFTNPVVLAVDLDFVKTVMVKDFQHFHDRGVYYNERDDPLSAHMFAIEGQKWKNLRTKLTPTFTSGKMKTMFPIITRISEEFKTTMAESASQNSEVEIRELLARFTTDVIGTCAFGLECNSLKDPNAEFRMYGRKLFENVNSAKAMFTMLFRSLSIKLHLKFTPTDVTKFFMGAVKDTVAYRESNNVKRNDFMDLLIEIKNSPLLENRLTIEEIAAQAFVFFLAGFETSSTVMSFALYELAANQEVQEKARECVRNTLKKHNSELTYESMMDMTYVTQCLNGEFYLFVRVIFISMFSISQNHFESTHPCPTSFAVRPQIIACPTPMWYSRRAKL